MDLTYPPEAEEFRREIRAWLDANLPEGWGTPELALDPEQRAAWVAEWNKKLYEGGWICASWPVEYGGKGLTVMQQVVLNEEFARAGAPLRADFFGDTLVGPTILQWGTDEQKRRFLPGIMRGETTWCQGFSEPDAGSDLASLRTAAVLDGDEWRITGQKIWTTQAQYADYMFLLARTDPEAPRHAGISYLLVPMRQPGIEVRPITQVDGSSEFNEVWLDGARCPRDNVVGGVNNGWKVAMTTLGFERGTSATTGFRRFRKELDQVIERARALGRTGDPLVRQDLARAWSTVKIMEINGYRSLTDVLTGRRDPGVVALGATNKMFWSEYHQWFTDRVIDLLGAEGQVLTGSGDEQFVSGIGRRRGRPGYTPSPLQSAFFFARSETIWGGSAEIQRNIVGERILGLPKEPKAPRGVEPKAPRGAEPKAPTG
ncbi:MAG TPA: acyl-CoA dehydrogenase family protein [Acidimicrobiales bacterium]|nr:acyl-CoA dehydrogenase family protein [Acidimicrobiales bacterium]